MDDFEDKKAVSFECNDGCGLLKISHSKWHNDDYIFINYFLPAFYAFQYGFWEMLKKRFKIALTILLGKEYTLYEIILENPEEIENFYQEMKKFIEK